MSKNGNGNGRNGNGRKSFTNLLQNSKEGNGNLNTDSKKSLSSVPSNFGQYNAAEAIRKLKDKYPIFFRKHKVRDILSEIGTIDPQSMEVYIRDHPDNRS